MRKRIKCEWKVAKEFVRFIGKQVFLENLKKNDVLRLSNGILVKSPEFVRFSDKISCEVLKIPL